jgi:hypothetical protein
LKKGRGRKKRDKNCTETRTSKNREKIEIER